MEEIPYPEGTYDEETSEYDEKGNRIKEKTKTDHYKDGKNVTEEDKKEDRARKKEERRKRKEADDLKEAAEEKAYDKMMTEKYGKGWWLREEFKHREENPRSKTPPPPGPGVSFRAGEVQWNLYGLGGTGHGEHLVTDTKTVVRTETVSTTEPALVDVPGIPGLVTRDVTTTREMKVKHTERHTRNAAALQGGFGGAGAEAKYFVTRNIGLGLEGDWLDGESSIGTAMGTMTARFPVGPCAPYVFGGAGVQFGDGTQAVGKLGGGLEHRFSPQTGVFVDAAWMFSDHENAAVFRAGLSLIR